MDVFATRRANFFPGRALRRAERMLPNPLFVLASVLAAPGARDDLGRWVCRALHTKTQSLSR